MENMTEKPVKKKKGLILGITIPLVVALIVGGIFGGIAISKNSKYNKALELLDDGDYADAIEIHEQLGDYKDLGDEISKTVSSRFKKQLGKGEYEKAAKLYDTVAGYPKAIEKMDKYLTEHVAEVMDDKDSSAAVELLDAFGEDETRKGLILGGIIAAADDMWESSFYDFLNFYQNLKNEEVYLEDLDHKICQYICENLAEQDYTDAFGYYELIRHSERCMGHIQSALVEEVGNALENDDRYTAQNIYSWMESYNIEYEEVSRLIYEYACELMERDEYEEARYCFQTLLDYNDPWFAEDSVYMRELAVLQYYISNEWYYDAKYQVDRFSGEIHDKLLEVLLEYCADKYVIADLEAALLARMTLEENGASYEELVEAEWEYLRKYQQMPFYDEYLEDLVMEYLYYLQEQEYALGYEDYYQFYYYWQHATADCYTILDLLNDHYGFGANDTRLQELLGISEALKYWTNAWYEIHSCLSWQLWDVVPYEEDGVYYLDLYNYTQYAFTVVFYEQFTYYEEIVGEYQSEELTLQPGETIRVLIAVPDTDVEYWFIDWDIFNIYDGDTFLG